MEDFIAQTGQAIITPSVYILQAKVLT